MRRVLILATAALGLAAAGSLALKNQALIFSWVRKPLPPPPVQAPDPLGPEMLQGRRNELVRKVSARYGAVMLELAAARRKGFNVDEMEAKMPRTLALAKQGKYRESLFLLNLIDVRIPRGGERVKLATEDDADTTLDEEVPSKPVPKQGRRKAPARKRR